MLRGLLFVVIAGFVALPVKTQTTAFKSYVDPQYGVSFQYPAQWKLDNSLMFYLGTQIVLNPDSSQEPDKARAIVGFERKLNAQGEYPDGVNLNGVEFVYLVLPHTDRAHCDARLGQGDDGRKQSQVVIHGVTYGRVHSGDAGMNHAVTRDIYGAFENGICYLFEGDIHTTNGNNPRTLGGAQLRNLQNQIAATMRSVKIRNKR